MRVAQREIERLNLKADDVFLGNHFLFSASSSYPSMSSLPSSSFFSSFSFLLSPCSPSIAQGTLRPDMIESGSAQVSKSADTIKTHHNDTNLVRELRYGLGRERKRKKERTKRKRKEIQYPLNQLMVYRALGKVVEPLSDYHKDEVRELGKELGLPEALVVRHPFPGLILLESSMKPR